MLDVVLTVLSFPFWFVASVFTIVGIFGTVKVNGMPYYGKYLLPIKVGITGIGFGFGAIAYAMIVLV